MISTQKFAAWGLDMLLPSFPGKSVWVFPKIGIPQNGWFMRENPIKMDDLGGFPPIFGSTPSTFVSVVMDISNKNESGHLFPWESKDH